MPREYDPQEDDRKHDDFVLDRTRIPVTVRNAGVVWIMCGALVSLAALKFLTTQAPDGVNPIAFIVGGLFCGLIGFTFVYVGQQSIRGTASGVAGNSIGSFLTGLIFIAV